MKFISGRNDKTKEALRICEKFMDSYNRRSERHITFEPSRTVIHASDKDKIYIPSPTGKLFHASNGFVDLIMGPYGSGKSTMCIQRIIESTCHMPKWFNGRRRARWAIVRNTSGELYSTTLQTWLTWFGDLGDIKKRQKPLLTYEHVFNDGNGIVELDVIFIALDRPEDVRKIKSLELTGAYLNELSELPQNVLSHFKGRVNGRYPSRSFCSETYWSGIIADTNPPDEDHWIFNDFEVNKTSNYHVFHQPSGLVEDEQGNFVKDKDNNYVQNIYADNAEHLSSDYYPKLAEKQSEGFIKVYCGGKYGLVESGKRVYPEFNYDIHSVSKLEAIQGEPLYLGFDFGLTPACVVVQLTTRGQVRVLKEYVAEDIGIKTFAKNIVIPRLVLDFPYCKVGGSEGDPSGAKGDEIMEELSCIGELNALGIKTNAATTNDPDVRINSVRYFLNLMIDGKPAFLISREDCPVLVKGFMSGYHFKRMSISGDERYQDKPNKNKYSHCFVGETLVETDNGLTRIDKLKINNKVLTPNGYKSITATMSSEVESLIDLTFSNGTKITCTPDHPFITKNGIIRADSLQYSDILQCIEENNYICHENQKIKYKNLMELNTIKKAKDITKLIMYYLEKLNICIETFGNFITGKSHMDIISITSTTTKVTITYLTFESLMNQNMQQYTEKKEKERMKQENIWHLLDHWRQNGIEVQKVKSFISVLEKLHGKMRRQFINVLSVIKNLNDMLVPIKKVFVHLIASYKTGDNQELITKKENVEFATNNLNAINTSKKERALRLVKTNYYQIQKKVYDLTIEDEHCFYANGILVSNCHDALQYRLMPFAGKYPKKEPPKHDPFANNMVMRWQN